MLHKKENTKKEILVSPHRLLFGEISSPEHTHLKRHSYILSGAFTGAFMSRVQVLQGFCSTTEAHTHENLSIFLFSFVKRKKM